MKYNYDAALELLVNAHKQNKVVTYQEMQAVLGLEKPIEDQSAASTNNSTLYEVRKRLKNEYGLVFKSAAKGSGKPELQHYTISEVKNTGITKKEVKPVKKTDTKDSNYEALSKDNQKLYAETERLKLENQRLVDEISNLKIIKNELSNIVNSLMVIANI